MATLRCEEGDSRRPAGSGGVQLKRRVAPRLEKDRWWPRTNERAKERLCKKEGRILCAVKAAPLSGSNNEEAVFYCHTLITGRARAALCKLLGTQVVQLKGFSFLLAVDYSKNCRFIYIFTAILFRQAHCDYIAISVFVFGASHPIRVSASERCILCICNCIAMLSAWPLGPCPIDRSLWFLSPPPRPAVDILWIRTAAAAIKSNIRVCCCSVQQFIHLNPNFQDMGDCSDSRPC